MLPKAVSLGMSNVGEPLKVYPTTLFRGWILTNGQGPGHQ